MAKKENPFDKLRFSKRDQDKSVDWFRNQVKTLAGGFTPERLMASRELITSKLVPGSLYMYYYDPKHKDTLPYYDTFPLVYPYRKTTDGFMGYNLHYLPPVLRFKVMGALINVSSSTESDSKRLAYSYGVLNSSEVNKYFAPCIKRYLSAHVMSRFLEIPEDAWLSAALLPTERFVNGSKQTAWKDTVNRA